MIYLRTSTKLLPLVSTEAEGKPSSDTALGDWYASLFLVRKQAMVMLVSSTSLLPMIELADDLDKIPERLPRLVERRLPFIGASEAIIRKEIAGMKPVKVAEAHDPAVLAAMVDFIRRAPDLFEGEGVPGKEEMLEVENKLALSPCLFRGEEVEWPAGQAFMQLHQKWVT